MATAYPKEDLERLRNMIRVAAGNKFDDLIAVSRRVNWVLKPSWFPFKEYCTTIGNTVYLSEDFFYKYLDWARCSLLLHESVHVQQWEKMGKILFSMAYAIPSKRLAFEKAGIRQEFFWGITTKKIADPEKQGDQMGYIRSHPFIKGSLDSLAEGYMMSPDREALNRWALTIVREGFMLGFDRY